MLRVRAPSLSPFFFVQNTDKDISLCPFPIQIDRCKAQFEEFARMIRNNTPGMYSYQHDLLVHEVTLAASGYIQWSE